VYQLSKKRYNCVLIIFFLIFSLILSGCGKKEEKEEVKQTTTQKVTTKTDKEKIIKIGAILPLTGPGAIFAQYIKEGIDLAIEEINSKTSQKIKIFYEDSKNQPKEAISVYNKLVELEKPLAVIVALSSVAKALAPLATPSKTVQIGIAVAIPGVTDISEYVFRIYPEAYDIAGIMATYDAKKLGCKTAGVIYINDDFGRSSYEVFKEVFEKYGGKITLTESYEPLQRDFRSQLLKLMRVNPDCIYLSGYGIAYGIIIKQLKELGINSQLTADMTLGLPNTLEQVGNSAEGAYFVDGKMSDEFIRKFKNRYNKEPASYAGYAYDIINILYKIITERKATTSDSVKDGLLKIKDYPGVMGKITILPNGDSTLQFVVKQIKNSRPLVVQEALNCMITQ